MEANNLSFCQWMKQQRNCGKYIYIKFYLPWQKKNILSFVTTRMNLEGNILSEIRYTIKQIPHGITYMWNQKKKKKKEGNKMAEE